MSEKHGVWFCVLTFETYMKVIFEAQKAKEFSADAYLVCYDNGW
jgi:hypothetical protein